jgi:hypothetical protein
MLISAHFQLVAPSIHHIMFISSGLNTSTGKKQHTEMLHPDETFKIDTEMHNSHRGYMNINISKYWQINYNESKIKTGSN